ncbi:MAG TPA: phosphoribosyltransferase [Thermoplasmata archaeon]|nr:phosphoribosyltransferase [Thermoplasmata archaeon]
MADLPRCRLTTWSDVDRWADRLAERIRSADAIPETIVALTRGGWVPSRLLCDRLGVKRLVSLRAQHWGVTATPDGKAQLTEGLSGPVDGQKVLVVDDITDTGESLTLAAAHVGEQHPSRLETAAFLHIAHSKFVPTYYAEEIPRTGWVWVVFPWNYWEDLASLATRAAEFGRGVATIRETLKTRSGLEVPLADLERVARFVRLQ